jgi:hypothetical protein
MPTPKKRGMIELNDEVMRETTKYLKEKGIKSEDVKNIPPIEELCKPIPRSSTIEVHSLQRFDNRDIPYSKPPDQCLDEFDNFIVKQDNFYKRVQNYLLENSRAINNLQDIMERTSNDVMMLVKHFQMVHTQIDQLTKVQKDFLVNASREKHACEISTRSGASTRDPIYPERIEQCAAGKGTLSKKKKHKAIAKSSKTEEVEEEPEKLAKNAKYTKEDFIADKHGSEREPWVQKTMLSLVRNTNPRKKNIITGFVNG